MYRAVRFRILRGICKRSHGKIFGTSERDPLSKPDRQPGPPTGTNSSELRRCIGEVSYGIQSNCLLTGSLLTLYLLQVRISIPIDH